MSRGWMTMALAVVVSWASMVVHNMFELPIAFLALENVGPLVAALVLLAAYLLFPGSRVPAIVLFVWAALNLVVGGILTVLPLPVLPFEPEQSVSHYVAHFVYSVGQVPLLVISLAAARKHRRG